VPGWDCHGLPIEWMIESQYRAKGQNKDEVPINEFRKECRDFAAHWLDVQREEFKRLGVTGDWDNPYSTMAFPAEAQIAREIMQFAMTDQLYRGSKPVMWSVVEKTSLAEAEIEYQDYQSDMVWVAFPVKGMNASVIIWTTTPWTLPGNRAISYHHKISYGLYEVTANERDFGPKIGARYVIADKLAEAVAGQAKITLERQSDVTAEMLAGLTCSHPLSGLAPIPPPSGEGGPQRSAGSGGGRATLTGEGDATPSRPGSASPPSPQGGGMGAYTFDVPLLEGDHVTDDAGTGFVHTAPGHGREDFDIWTAAATQQKLRSQGIDTKIPYTVDGDGFYTAEAPGFEGRRVITDKGDKGDANEAVIKALIEVGNLVARGRLKHQYPHSWRSKKPVIFRNTPQWFIHMDRKTPSLDGKTLREVSLRSIRETQWVPPAGENRITGMIEAKPDWVVSRQRAWGVPITVFVDKANGEVLKDERVNARIAAAFEQEGGDAWFADADGSRFLKPEYNPADFEKINDVLDVWFDSGSTHSYVLNDPKNFPSLARIRRKVDGGKDQVMYLEGSDQHRGWFHSSLIESSGTRGRAPYDIVLTHGFVLDEKGQKMSKSVGNVVAPQDVMKNSGADILRLWVAASDYSDDLRIGPEILKGFIDSYRKLRNTMRWMLGTLAHFEPGDAVAAKDMPELERLMLHRLAELDGVVTAAYAGYDYKKVVSALSTFMNTDLSAFYFDIRKDTLYCEPLSSLARRSALTAIDRICDAILKWLAPILVFTADEAWTEYNKGDADCVHLLTFPEGLAMHRDDALAEKWDMIRDVRSVITGALEIQRASKVIGSSLEAAPVVHIADPDLLAALADVDMAEVAITSAITLTDSPAPADAFTSDQLKSVAVVFAKAAGRKCARSWRYTDDVGSDPAWPDVSARDAKALDELKALGRLSL
ncbi:MAG: isoleucine--tRNA ligase, partial [Beijerinckiaceae bacterium]